MACEGLKQDPGPFRGAGVSLLSASGAAGGGCVCGRLNGCLLMTYGLLWLSGS
jgi:hypothetical protein